MGSFETAIAVVKEAVRLIDFAVILPSYIMGCFAMEFRYNDITGTHFVISTNVRRLH